MWKQNKETKLCERTLSEPQWVWTAMLIAILFVCSLVIYPIALMNSESVVTFTVSEKYGVYSQSEMYVVTDKGRFNITDEIWYSHWDSDEVFEKLKPGKTYTVRVTGWRVPDFDLYPNIISIK